MRFSVPFALGLACLSFPAAAQFQPWRAAGGQLVVRLDQAGLSGAGLQVIEADQTGLQPGAVGSDGAVLAFNVQSDGDLLVLVGHTGEFVAYGVLGGGVTIEGGFTLASPSTGGFADFHAARFHHLPAFSDGPGGEPDPDYMFLTGSGAEPGLDLVVRTPKIHFDPEGLSPYTPDHVTPLISILAWDLVVTQDMAARLRRPDLAGAVLGGGELLVAAEAWYDPWSYPRGLNPWTPFTGAADAGPGPGDGGALDVSLSTLGTIVEKNHEGAFPNGRQSMSMSTTSCNVGGVSVPWQQAMDPDHPGIAMQLYREMGNRFEQVGVSWIKHGFFSTNQSTCGACTTPGGPGNQLGVNCSDTYGTSNNSDPMWLGPRSEWSAFDVAWEPCGSFFDGVPVDCARSENGGSFANKVDHRLEAFDADLGLPGATYFYEAMYLVQGDVDKANNIASRRTTMTWTGSIWDIVVASGSNTQVAGPALNRWAAADKLATAGLAPHDGEVVVGVNTVDLGGGLTRYEYAVLNWNMDRKLRSFSVPTGSAMVTDQYFHDIDNLTANDWVATVAGGMLTWEFPDVDLPGVKVAGAMGFLTLYNFGFTSNVAPGDRDATVAPHLAGPGGDLLAVPTRAPAGLNLTATKLAPAELEPFSLVMTGGTANMMVAVIEVSGIPLGAPVLIGPVPFVGGTASFPLAIPAGLSGLDFLMVGGDVTTGPLSLLQLGNTITLAVQ
jgi:hypothetical protein